MNEMNFDWDDLRLFLAVARAEGLAGAARQTGKSPPTLGRRMQALERVVGAELFRRLPRGYVLTQAGQEFLERVEALEARIVPMAAQQDRTLVKVSAGTWMTRVLCAQADRITGADEKVVLRFIAADHMLDISRREAVIGVRNARPEQVGLAARKVGVVRFCGYAADRDVTHWVRVLGATPSARWVAEQAATHLEVTAPINALDLARAGQGRAVLPCVVGDAEPGLERVTPVIEALTHEQWLVTHDVERFEPAVRRTIDRIADVLTALHAPG